MKTEDYEKLIRIIADKNGVTPGDVEREMQTAIDEGMKSRDPAIRKTWAKLSPSGRKPSPKDVIEYAVNRVRNVRHCPRK